MANRFLDTNYYKSPFVRGLKGPLKSLYSFIICDCDGAGIWNLDFQAASMYTGFEITMQEFEQSFVVTGKAVDIGNGKYFFPDFIEHQYPGGLQANNKAHKNFIICLKKFNLIDEALVVKKIAPRKPLQSPKEAPSKPPLRDPMSSNGNGLVKVKSIMAKEDFIKFQSDLIQDKLFVEQIMSSRGIRELNVLFDWIKAFNVHITGEGKLDKDYDEYRRHFKNWIVLQDTTKAPPVIPSNGTTAHSTIKKATDEVVDKYRRKNV
jgi:hypothetical protein